MIAVASLLIRRHPPTARGGGGCSVSVTHAGGGWRTELWFRFEVIFGIVCGAGCRLCSSFAPSPESVSLSLISTLTMGSTTPLAPQIFKSLTGHVFQGVCGTSRISAHLSSSHAKLRLRRIPVEAAEACAPAATSSKILNADAAS
jgi:hypothetical protein